MLWNLILGAAAGALTPLVEPHIRRAIEGLALSQMPVGKTEFDVLSLLTMLMAAAILVALVGADSSAFVLLLGALAGLFGKRAVETIANPGPPAATNPGTGSRYSAPSRPQPPRPTPPEPRGGQPDGGQPTGASGAGTGADPDTASGDDRPSAPPDSGASS